MIEKGKHNGLQTLKSLKAQVTLPLNLRQLGKKIAQSKYEGYYELTSKNNYANSNQTEKRVKRNSWTQNLTIEQVKRTTYQFNGRYIEKYLINRPPSKQTILHDKKK